MCLVNFGPNEGKLATIVNVVDQNTVLVDGPFEVTGVRRHVINLKWLSLTPLLVNIKFNARSGTVAKALAADNTIAKWNESSWAKRIAAKKRRASLNDFERFSAMVLRKKRAALVNGEFGKLRVAARKA